MKVVEVEVFVTDTLLWIWSNAFLLSVMNGTGYINQLYTIWKKGRSTWNWIK